MNKKERKKKKKNTAWGCIKEGGLALAVELVSTVARSGWEVQSALLPVIEVMICHIGCSSGPRAGMEFFSSRSLHPSLHPSISLSLSLKSEQVSQT